MLVKAKIATFYEYRGLIYRWEKPGDEIEVPDKLGEYLTAQRTEVWSRPEAEQPEPPELHAPDQPSEPVEPPAPEPERAAPPELGIMTSTADIGISKAED
jgi:hypothetical protein